MSRRRATFTQQEWKHWKAQRQHRRERSLRTPDDWHPTPKTGEVRAMFMPLLGGGWRIAVWGGDDFGLERDFPEAALDEAMARFTALPNPVTQAALRAEGFIDA